MQFNTQYEILGIKFTHILQRFIQSLRGERSFIVAFRYTMVSNNVCIHLAFTFHRQNFWLVFFQISCYVLIYFCLEQSPHRRGK